MKKNKKWILHYFGVSVLFAFLFLGMVEIGLRCDKNFKEKKESREWLRSLMSYDSMLGWRNVPNSCACSKTSEYEVCYRMNSKGFRDRERLFEKQSKFRIVCIGDSITFGWGINRGNRFSDILEKQFSMTDVINMGVQGYGIDQMLILLEKEGIKYNPDIVVIYLIHHDLERALHSKMWDRPKPQFLITNNELILSNVPVPKIDIFSFGTLFLDRLRYQLAKRSYLFYFLHDSIYRWRERRIKDEVKYKTNIEGLKLVKAIFKKMQKLAKEYKFKLVIAGDFPMAMKVFFRENNIFICDNPLSNYKKNNTKVFYQEYHHPTAFGHRLIAEGIRCYLTSKGLIPKEFRSDSGKKDAAK